MYATIFYLTACILYCIHLHWMKIIKIILDAEMGSWTMRIHTVNKHRAPESLSSVLTNLAARQVNTFFKKGENREFVSGLYGLRNVFVSIVVKKKRDWSLPFSGWMV